MSTTCQVCSSNPAKYRCPACRLESCSLDCTKQHKGECPGPPAQKTSDELATNVPADAGLPMSQVPGTTTQIANPNSIFAGLGSDPSLPLLFKRYPTLRSDLQNIFQLTREPEPETELYKKYSAHFTRRRYGHRGRGRGGRFGANDRNVPPWTPERGFKVALSELRRTYLEKEGPAGDGVRELLALLESLVAKEVESSATLPTTI